MFQKEKFLEICQEEIDFITQQDDLFDKTSAIEAAKEFYAEFNLPFPKHIYVYNNGKEMADNFEEWSLHVKTSPTSWDWQRPLMAYGINLMLSDEYLHIGWKRSFLLKNNRLVKTSEEFYDEGLNEVPKLLLMEMWKAFYESFDVEKIDTSLTAEVDIAYDYENIMCFFDDLLDSSSQESGYEVFFTGRSLLFLYEVASYRYLAAYYNVKRNSNYYKVIRNLLVSSGPIVAANEACIILER